MNETRRLEAGLHPSTGSGRAAFFDVFDTVLVRSVAAPTDLFRLLHAELAAGPPGLPEGWDEDVFAIARIRAEREALVGREECTLAQIWDTLAAKIPGLDPAQGMAAELRLEAASLRPVPQGRARVQAARRAGHRIAFLSDTYLPAAFIHEQLERAGMLHPGDGLFVSSEHGTTKRCGGLYGLALARLGLQPGKAEMLGDNPRSDVQMARRNGLAARPFDATALQGLELAAATVPGLPRLARARLAGRLRLERLQASAEPGSSLYAVHFLGPVSLLWGLWALHRAKSLGLDRLYFVSRDAYLAWRCASRLAPAFGVECRYLSISRRCLQLAGTPEVSAAGLEWLMPWWNPPLRLSTVLLRLDLTRGDVPELLAALGVEGEADPMLGRDQAARFLQALQAPALRALVEARIAARREPARRYLAQEGLLDDDRWSVVDIRWHLSVQRSLRGVVAPARVRGFYLYLDYTRLLPAEAGDAEAMFDCVLPDCLEQLPPIVTQFGFAEDVLGPAPHGTVLDFAEEGGRIVPRLAEMAPEEVAWKRRLCAAVEAFADRSAAEFHAALPDAVSCAAAFRTLTDAFVRAPEPALAAELAAAPTMREAWDGKGEPPLVIPYGWRDAALEVLPRWRAERLQPRRVWPQGSLAVSSPAVRQALRLSAWLRRRLGWE